MAITHSSTFGDPEPPLNWSGCIASVSVCCAISPYVLRKRTSDGFTRVPDDDGREDDRDERRRGRRGESFQGRGEGRYPRRVPGRR